MSISSFLINRLEETLQNYINISGKENINEEKFQTSVLIIKEVPS